MAEVSEKRSVVACRSETCTLESEREYWEEIYSHFEKRPVTLLGVEEEVEHKTKYSSGKASYVERNYAMIDDRHLKNIADSMRVEYQDIGQASVWNPQAIKGVH